jgi:transposase-like protein
MSSKKITDADKLEIVDLYRQSGETTSSLANRYGVSNSTISRLLKTNIPETEYEILIQQKRGSKAGSDEDSSNAAEDPIRLSQQDGSKSGDDKDRSVVIDEPIVVATTATPTELQITDRDRETIAAPEDPAVDPQIAATTVPADLVDLVVPSPSINASEDSSTNSRRVRRRSSAPVSTANDEPPADKSLPTGVDPLLPAKMLVEEAWTLDGKDDKSDLFASDEDLPSAKTIIPPPIPRTPVLREILSDSQDRYFKPPVVPPPLPEIPTTDESEEDPDPEDVNALAAMFGEEISDGEDDEEEDDDDDDDDESANSGLLDRNQVLTSDRLHVQVTPLSQATLPRTCYIVIDKFAELIVRPLKDFADLGQIPSAETLQRTLPVFDNHRVAKRFSNQRTQRVIKIPDSRVFYKTSEHLRLKGIACLLVDGNIYSLN